ncbi:MAG TPA: CPBP family intramembrane metalloprotease [bacterium]|nr:CPBP family intramembrane metalloprotease [bacterium]HPQ65864.1 CPBP family intramembrane metalloprotease [bacterium]
MALRFFPGRLLRFTPEFTAGWGPATAGAATAGWVVWSRILEAAGGAPGPGPQAAVRAWLFFTPVLLVVAVWARFHPRDRALLVPSFRGAGRAALRGLRAYACFLPFLIALSVLPAGPAPAARDFPGFDLLRLISGGQWPNVAAGLLAALVLGPLAEETVFRGIVYGGLRRSFPAPAAIVLSSLIFALMHPLGAATPAVFFLSMLLAAILERTRTVTAPVLIHSLHNLVAIGYFLLAG